MGHYFRDRIGHEPVPRCAASGQLGGIMSGQLGERRQAQEWPDSESQSLVAPPLMPMRLGGIDQEKQLSLGSVPPTRTQRCEGGQHCRRACVARNRLSHPQSPSGVSRSRCRLFRQAPPRQAEEEIGEAAGGPRFPSYPGGPAPARLASIFEGMKKKPHGAAVPMIAVDRKGEKPLHRQIYEAFRSMVLERRLQPGQQIPSSRALAVELGISRIPVLNAYAQLLAEGYIESRSGAGTFVTSSLSDQFAGTRPALASVENDAEADAVSRVSRLLPGEAWIRGSGAFSVGQIAYDHFPFRVWSDLVTRHARRVRAGSLHYADPMGSEKFREVIAAYLRTARAVHCEVSQIMVVNGSQHALDLSARVLLDPDTPVWIEEPGYEFLRHALKLSGCRLVPVPVDSEGLDVAAGIKLCRNARVAYVTPSHQYPLGATMSAARRLQPLA